MYIPPVLTQVLDCKTDLALLLKRVGELGEATSLLTEVVAAQRLRGRGQPAAQVGAGCSHACDSGGDSSGHVGGTGSDGSNRNDGEPAAPSEALLRSLSNLGQCLKEAGQVEEARALLAEAVDGAMATLGVDHQKTKNYQRSLARLPAT